jgi:hypothetical protein
VRDLKYVKINNITEADAKFPMPFYDVPDELESSGIEFRNVSLFT